MACFVLIRAALQPVEKLLRSMIRRQKSGSKCSFTSCKPRFLAGFFLVSSSLATFLNGLLAPEKLEFAAADVTEQSLFLAAVHEKLYSGVAQAGFAAGKGPCHLAF